MHSLPAKDITAMKKQIKIIPKLSPRLKNKFYHHSVVTILAGFTWALSVGISSEAGQNYKENRLEDINSRSINLLANKYKKAIEADNGANIQTLETQRQKEVERLKTIHYDMVDKDRTINWAVFASDAQEELIGEDCGCDGTVEEPSFINKYQVSTVLSEDIDQPTLAFSTDGSQSLLVLPAKNTDKDNALVGFALLDAVRKQVDLLKAYEAEGKFNVTVNKAMGTYRYNEDGKIKFTPLKKKIAVPLPTPSA